MTLVRIDDPDDPRLAPYRDVRERDLVGRQGRFMAEGEVVLRALLASPTHRAESVLLAERGRVERLGPFLKEQARDVPVYVAPQAVMDTVAGLPLHRGVLAIGRRHEPPDAAALLARLPARALVVGLVGLSNADNVGGVFRNALAFGADAVLLDETSCDPLYRKAIRVSTGAALRLPWARAGSGGALAATLAAAGFTVIALSPNGVDILARTLRPRRVAVLLGTEGPGLPEALLAQTRTVRIPMAPGVDSLNVAATSAVVLHHLASAADEP